MDIIFKCPKCSQELAVDSTGAGSEIDCPACGETIVIPAASEVSPAAAPEAPQLVSSMASSAAAKVEMHLKVPVSAKPTTVLIEKSAKPLEVAAKESDKKIRVKTIRHSDCVEVGHDKFDDVISNFLNKVGQPNIVSITPISYSHLDIGSQKLLTEYGVFVVYRG